VSKDIQAIEDRPVEETVVKTRAPRSKTTKTGTVGKIPEPSKRPTNKSGSDRVEGSAGVEVEKNTPRRKIAEDFQPLEKLKRNTSSQQKGGGGLRPKTKGEMGIGSY